MSKKSGFGKLALGVAIGGALGVLFAPKSGKETRKALKEKTEELLDKVKELDAKEVKDEIEKIVSDIIDEIKDLDKEKALKIAKKKAADLKSKADDLVAYAKKKATPVVEEAAEAVRQKAVDVTKGVLAKLENK